MSQTRLFRYAALGDSSSVGIGAGADGGYPERIGRLLKAEGVPVGLLNLGQSGAVSSDVATRQVERAVAKAPDLVTLGIGGNDTWRLVPEEQFARNLQRIGDRLSDSGAQVVVCNIPDLGLAPAAAIAQSWLGIAPSQITARIRELNRHFAQLAQRPRFTVVDLFTESQQALAGRSELFSPDGFHPSAAGYEHWARICWPAVWKVAQAWLAQHQAQSA